MLISVTGGLLQPRYCYSVPFPYMDYIKFLRHCGSCFMQYSGGPDVDRSGEVCPAGGGEGGPGPPIHGPQQSQHQQREVPQGNIFSSSLAEIPQFCRNPGMPEFRIPDNFGHIF